MYSKILIRFGELSTKGKNKNDFIKQLNQNIFKLCHIKTSEVSHDRIFVPYSEENMKNLGYVFGIYSYSPVAECKTSEEDIAKTILELLKDQKHNSFRVTTHRNYKNFDYSSMDFSKHIGSIVAKKFNWKVDLNNYDLNIEIEIRENTTYIFFERTKGLGGYPVGIGGRVIHLISGGIDSPIAALQMMKRGVHVDFLNFITPPQTDQKTIDKVDKIINLLIKYQGSATLYRNNFSNILSIIDMTSDQSYKIILMRRSFYRLASRIAKDHHYLGISNGENLGQVASQTLESMAVIEAESSFPIYRPLLTEDKIDTINKAEKVGTLEISNEPANESCELFAPKNPTTKPRIGQAQKLEDELSELKEYENQNYENNWIIKKFSID